MFSSDEIDCIAQQIMAYHYKLWGFGEGIALEAVWQAGIVLNKAAYCDWVVGMMNRWLQREPRLVEADHSAPGALLVQVYRATEDARFLHLALDLAAHMRQLPSHQSGVRLHRPLHPEFHHFIYVDCMEVDAPFFCELAQATGDDRYFDDAAQQLLSYSRQLQDEHSGLFNHQFDAESNTVNGVFWGRGNGWALLGMLKSLRLMPKNHPSYADLLHKFQRLAASIAATQLPEGDWPTVLNVPATHAEGSLAAMFAYGLSAGTEAHLLPDSYEHTVSRAYDALRRRLLSDGRLDGVSIATPPGSTAAHYDNIPLGANVPWGQGPLLLAALQLSGFLPPRDLR